MLRSGIVFVVLAGCFGAAGCGGCTAIERGRYRCDPTVDAGTVLADEQCPGASRCGQEEYCHDIGDTSVAWRCRDRNDCENGYECGLARDHSFRECHDPGVEDAGYPCLADTDCVRGWHCGAKELCYDRSVKAAFPCRPDAGDCADGWRCGREGVCQDRQVADAYPCKTDPDCEQEWRCGLDGRCLNPAGDALRPGFTALGPIEKRNPLLLDHPPEMLEVSPVQEPVFNSPRQQIVLYDEGALRVLELSVGGVPAIGTNPHRLWTLPDAGPVVALASLGSISLDVFARPDIGTWTYLARPTGELVELHFRTTGDPFFDFDGGVFRHVYATDSFVADYVALGSDRLRVGSAEPGFVPTLNAFDTRPFAAGVEKSYFYGWGAISHAWYFPSAYPHTSDFVRFDSRFETPAGNRLTDLVTFTAHRRNPYGWDQNDCAVIADGRGLSVQQTEWERGTSSTTIRRYYASPLIATPFANGECTATTGVPQSHHITHLAGLGGKWLAVAARPLGDGGVELPETQVALLDVSEWWEVLYPNDDIRPFRGCSVTKDEARCIPFVEGASVYPPATAVTALGPCRVCAGGTLVAVSAVPIANGGAKLEVRCRFTEADGGAPSDSVVELANAVGLGSQCVRTTVQGTTPLLSDPVMLSTSSAEQLAFAGPRGHLWAGSSTSTAVPVFFDVPAVGVFSDPAGAPVFLAPDRIGWFADGFGLLAFRLNPLDGDRPVAAVVGARKELITAARAVMTFEGVAAGDSPAPLVLPDPSSTAFNAPFLAVRANRRDGAKAVVVSANDAVFAATIGTSKSALVRRVIPAEGKAILALLPVASPAGGPLLTVYALTTSGLFRITAETEQLWTSAPAPLPPGEAVALWADGARGRIGYGDGRVYALETRVQIGASLGKRVDDFEQLCGQAYALSEGSLHRLDLPAGETIGQWKPVPLGAAFPADDLERGSLVPFTEPDGGTSLYVFSRRGEAIRAPVTGCP